MKLWKKIYFITLILSIVVINGGIFMVFHMTYRENIVSEKNKSKVIYHMLCDTIEGDMHSLYENGRLYDLSIIALLKNYQNYYKDENIILGMKTDTRVIYWENENAGVMDDNMFKNGSEVITINNAGGMPTIFITKNITTEYEEEYFLYYEKPLHHLNDTWKLLSRRYLVMSAVISAMLAIFLIIILKRLTRPIEKLSDAVSVMKQGGFDSYVHVKIKGNDDIAMLGKNFNDMSDIISENIRIIQKENENKQQFIDNFAHELKTPLTSIYGYAEYVRNTNVSHEECMDYMQIVMEECNRMLGMAYSLLDLSELRNQSISVEQIKVEDLLKKVNALLRSILERKKIKFTWDTQEEFIVGNKDLIFSLIVNLVKNSANACNENGEIKVTVSSNQISSDTPTNQSEPTNKALAITSATTSATSDYREFYEITISDNGCGMSDDEIQHILEPFYRADKSRSRKNGGNGLGLTLCDRIVTAHGGKMKINSKKNKGTNIIITLKK